MLLSSLLLLLSFFFLFLRPSPTQTIDSGHQDIKSSYCSLLQLSLPYLLLPHFFLPSCVLSVAIVPFSFFSFFFLSSPLTSLHHLLYLSDSIFRSFKSPILFSFLLSVSLLFFFSPPCSLLSSLFFFPTLSSCSPSFFYLHLLILNNLTSTLLI